MMKLGQHKQKSFRVKLIFIFLFVAMVPLIAVAWSNFYLVTQNREQNVLELQRLALANAEDKVSRLFNEKIDNLQLVVSAPIDTLYQLRASDIKFLLESSFSPGYYKRLDMIDKTGNLLATIGKDSDFSINKIYLDNFSSTSPYVSELESMIDEKKAVYFSGIEGDLKNLPDFQTAILGDNYFGPKEEVDGESVMRIASQIMNSENEVIGVISAEINTLDIQKQIELIQVGNEGGIIILDSEGLIIYQSKKSPFLYKSEMTVFPLINKLIEKKQIGVSSYEEYIYNEKQRVLSGRYYEKLNWYFLSDWPVKDAFSVVGNLFSQTSKIFFGIIVLVVVIALIFSSQVTKPVKKLTEGVKRIKEGKLDQDISIKTDDEFEVLGEQFNEMTKVLKENKELRDEFVFVAAHELRTPVTAIKGYLSMVLEGGFGEINDKTKDALMICNKSNERLVQLVQDLLEIARSEAGRMKIELKKNNINELIDTTIGELKSLSDEKGIKVSYKNEGDRPVLADQAKLQEVLVNIVGNAIKYTKGDGDIEIWHEEKEEFLVTHIKDHGIGMTKEEVDQLFSKFYRAQNEDTANIQGTGLGLFICKEIINKMKGEVWVESEKGKGSVFSFKLKKE
ncbi:hypothetical protein C0583_00610 [Candidatus Parcubacteria bacterium]|nr:MAG: hypothetical protein C0583_00610 [Candidatus Parcubacteria bacterium]